MKDKKARVFDHDIPKWWSHAQRARLKELQALEKMRPELVRVMYCNRAENGHAPYQHCGPVPYPGLVEDYVPHEAENCGEQLTMYYAGLHTTYQPLRYRGSRVWVVALIGERVDEEHMSVGEHREWIGEIFHSDGWDTEACLRASTSIQSTEFLRADYTLSENDRRAVMEET